MELVDKIKKPEVVEKLTEERKDDLFVSLITGKDATEEVETARGKFTVKYPKPADQIMIARMEAIRRGNTPIESFGTEAETINRMICTLDAVVVSGPKWYEDVKKQNPDFSFAEVPDFEFMMELYGKVYSFREEIVRRLNSPGRNDKRVPAAARADDSVDSGAFGNISGESGNPAAD